MCPLHPEPLSRSLPTPFLQVVTEQVPCVTHQTRTGNLVYRWRRAGAVLSLVTHLCPTLDPVGCSPPGPSVHGILQARALERAAMPSSTGSFQPRDQTQVSGILYHLCHQGSMFLMLFSQIIPPSPSPTESKSPSFPSVSALLSCTQDHRCIFLDSICMC